jgi:hypothetical protein
VPPIDRVFLLHASRGELPSIETLLEEISKRGPTLVRDGRPGSIDETSELESQLAEFRRDRLPIYRQLGVS